MTFPIPRHTHIKRLCANAVGTFEHDPDFQVRFHFAAMIFWLINATAGVIVFTFCPGIWIKVGVLYVFLLSIYANWDTDYDAVSAASSYKHALATHTQLDKDAAP